MTRRPASLFQRTLMTMEDFRPGFAFDPELTLSITLRLEGPIDPDRLDAAYVALLARHEAFRSRIVRDGDAVEQEVRPHVFAALTRVEADGRTDAEVAAEWADVPIPAHEPPLVRGFLRGADLIGLTMHHLISDPTSLWIATRDLAALYRGDTLPPPLQYGEYAEWQAARLADRFAADRTSWAAALDGLRPVLIPGDRPFVPGHAVLGRELRARVLDADQLAAVTEWARGNRGTVFTTLFAGFLAVVADRCDAQDLCAMTILEQRDHPSARETIGPMIYPTLVRARLPRGGDFCSHAATVRDAVLASYARAQFPLVDLFLAAPQLLPGLLGEEPAAAPVFQYIPSDLGEIFHFGTATGSIVSTSGRQGGVQGVALQLRVRRSPEGDLVGTLYYDAAHHSEAGARGLLSEFTERLERECHA